MSTPQAGSLFRMEVFEHRRQEWLGRIVLARPLSFAVMTMAACACAALVLAYLTWGEYTRKAHVTGLLAPHEGLVKVYAPSGGTVVERHVEEGQTVRAGDPLFVVSYERSSAREAETQAAIGRQLAARRDSLVEDLAKQRNLQRQQEEALARRVEAMRAERAQLQAEIATQQRRTRIAEEGARSFDDLRARGFVSELQMQQKSAEVLEQQSKLQSLERARMALERDAASAESDLRDMPLKAQREAWSIERNVAAIEQDLAENEAKRRAVVTAPQDGVATAIQAMPGQSLVGNMPLAAIVPSGSALEAQLFAPTRAIGFVKPGQKVVLRYAAYPYQKFGHHEGRVTSVSRTALQPGEMPAQFQAQGNEPVYRITVALPGQSVLAYGKPEPLQAGMQLEADIEIDRRRLIEWIFEPLISVRGRI